MTAVIVIEGVVILLLAVLVAGLLKSHAEILRQLNALGATEDGSVTVGSAQTRPRTTGLEKAPTTSLTGVDLVGGSISQLRDVLERVLGRLRVAHSRDSDGHRHQGAQLRVAGAGAGAGAGPGPAPDVG
jgi:hypothetical protein